MPALRPDRLLILHHGALGDLLCAWPALAALARHFAGAQRYALVRPAHHFLIRPLGYLPCPDELRGAEDAFHGTIPPPDDTAMFRFCLDKLPAHIPQGAHCLAALSDEPMPVSHALLARLQNLGLQVPDMEDCLTHFRELFGGWKGQESRLAGILPGSGHRAKNWPPERFAETARELAREGRQPVQLLGPVEQERNIRLPDVPARCPQDVAELADMLAQMRFVFGNDSGPLHLAAWLGVPCAALFGPSDARRWGPPCARILSSPLPCAPCTRDMRSLDCPRPECMDALGTDQVLHALRTLVRESSPVRTGL